MADRARYKQAVRCLFHASSEHDRKEADHWLEQWQLQPAAWEIADSVLHDKTCTEEEQYFAAQTLRTKVQRDFEELPADSALSLRDSLLVLLIEHSERSKMVRVQLCLAIASIAIHLPASHWGPEGIIVWLYNRLKQEPAEVAMSCMLELLAVLPQEAGSERVAVRPERRRQAVVEMRAMLPQGLAALEACLQHPSRDVKERVLQAFAQWIQLSAAEGLDGAALCQSQLVQLAFAGLHAQETFDAAVDAVSELVWCTVRTDSEGMPTIKADMQPFVSVLVGEVMKLRPRFKAAVQRAMNEIAQVESTAGIPDTALCDDDDHENARGMVRLFLDVAEAYDYLLSSGAPELMAPVEAALEVTMHPDNAISTMSLGFFSKLAMRIQQRRYDDPSARARLQGYFRSLVKLIQGRVRYPVGYETWSGDERREFKRQRYNIQDTLTDAASVIGSHEMLQLLIQPLHAVALQTQAGNALDWRTAEAALFCIKGIASDPPPFRDPTMVELLRSLPQLPPNPQLQYTACTVIQRYAAWLCSSALEDPSLNQLVPPLLKLTMSMMNAHDASGGASLAFTSLCYNCAPFVRDNLSEMLALLTEALKVETWKGAGSMRGKGGLEIEEEDVYSIIEGITIVISNACSRQDREAEKMANHILASLCESVSAVISAAKAKGLTCISPSEAELYAAAKHAIPRVSMFFEKMNAPQLALQLFLGLWPQVLVYLEFSGSDAALVEACLKIVTRALRALGTTGAEQWLPTLLDFLPKAFVSTSHPAYLYVISNVLKAFGQDPVRQPALHAALVPMVSHACSRLATLKDFNEMPDCADDLFLLGYRGITGAPGLIMSDPILQLMLDTALRGMLVQHRDAHRSIQLFIQRLSAHKSLAAHPNPQAAAQLLKALFETRMPTLLQLYMAAVVGVASVSRFPEMCEALQSVLHATGAPGLQWLYGAVSLIPDHCATSQDKENFMSIVAQSLQANPNNPEELDQGAWRIEQAMKELADICRRTRRVRQNAENALLPPEIRPYIMAAY